MTEAVPRRRIQWPLLAIVVAAIGLIIIRMRWPRLLFDTTSLILFSIAAVAWALAFVPIKKLKWGDFEAELEPLVDEFEQKVVESEAVAAVQKKYPLPAPLDRDRRPHGTVYRGDDTEAAEQHGAPTSKAPTWEAFVDEYTAIVNSPAADMAKIVSAAILVERVITTTGEAFGLELRGGPSSVVNRLAEQKLINPEERDAFAVFWKIRGEVVHGATHVTPALTTRILDLAWRLIRTFA